ncbi:hypothetical protein CRYUN_Cryun21dG0090500 [Craigia yunnanensis]
MKGSIASYRRIFPRSVQLLVLFIESRRNKNFFYIRVGLDEAEALIQKMDLEARSLQPNAKVMVLAKFKGI